MGVLALAMIGIRAAIDRRRTIGSLRALGNGAPRVLVGLLVEAALTATLGVLAGVGSGLLIGQFFFSTVGRSSSGIDIDRIGAAVAIVCGTVVVVTAPLAWRAAGSPPSEAVRIIG